MDGQERVPAIAPTSDRSVGRLLERIAAVDGLVDQGASSALTGTWHLHRAIGRNARPNGVIRRPLAGFRCRTRGFSPGAARPEWGLLNAAALRALTAPRNLWSESGSACLRGEPAPPGPTLDHVSSRHWPSPSIRVIFRHPTVLSVRLQMCTARLRSPSVIVVAVREILALLHRMTFGMAVAPTNIEVVRFPTRS
jgi:hypothetical protein